MAGRNIFIVRPSRHLQVPRRYQLSGVLVVFDMVGLHNPVAVCDFNVIVEGIKTSHLGLRPVRFNYHKGRVVHRQQHLGLGIAHLTRSVGKPTRHRSLGWCLSRHLLRRQMWMTCRNHRDSYQEVNSLQGASGNARASSLHRSLPRLRRTTLPDSLQRSVSAAKDSQQGHAAQPKGSYPLFVRFEACQTYHPLKYHALRLNDFTEASLDFEQYELCTA